MHCWSGCFAGDVAVEAGGSVVAHGRRLQAAVLWFQTTERERFLLFPSPPFPFLYFRFSVVSLYPPGQKGVRASLLPPYGSVSGAGLAALPQRRVG
ncbi:hypothetical protein D5086_003752 [Populus alba]|uniref:Uncharacterized protein n=1 Tax=Populus alba TaxID=43335 RepID=A0ACC4D7C4_POPAL